MQWNSDEESKVPTMLEIGTDSSVTRESLFVPFIDSALIVWSDWMAKTFGLNLIRVALFDTSSSKFGRIDSKSVSGAGNAIAIRICFLRCSLRLFIMALIRLFPQCLSRRSLDLYLQFQDDARQKSGPVLLSLRVRGTDCKVWSLEVELHGRRCWFQQARCRFNVSVPGLLVC